MVFMAPLAVFFLIRGTRPLVECGTDRGQKYSPGLCLDVDGRPFQFKA